MNRDFWIETATLAAVLSLLAFVPMLLSHFFPSVF